MITLIAAVIAITYTTNIEPVVEHITVTNPAIVIREHHWYRGKEVDTSNWVVRLPERRQLKKMDMPPALPRHPKVKPPIAFPPLPPAPPTAKASRSKASHALIGGTYSFTVTNGNGLTVWITAKPLPSQPPSEPPSLPGEPPTKIISAKALASNAANVILPPGPHFYQWQKYCYFPPDPFAGCYFQADAENIPVGHVSVQVAETPSGPWGTVYSTTWTDPNGILGTVFDWDLRPKFVRIAP